MATGYKQKAKLRSGETGSLWLAMRGRVGSWGFPALSHVEARNFFASALFLLYFCDEIAASVLFRLFGSSLIAPAYNIVFLTLLFLCCLPSKVRRLAPAAICYGLVFSAIGATILCHPEYRDWFFGERYGLNAQFLTPRGGIWAFLVIALVPDRRRLYDCLKLTAWLMLVYQAIRYATTMSVGYWEEIDRFGNTQRQTYNLVFGYETLFPTAFFGARAFLEKTRWCYLPFAFGLYLILMGGSRGAFVFIAALFALAFAFRWRVMGSNGRIIAVMVGISLLLFILSDGFLAVLSALSGALGIESRTLTSLLSGTLDDSNGRDVIYGMAIDLIREGGPFGHGVYGERTTVGQSFVWGYSHNIFLEIYVAFGYLGGTVLSGLLIGGIVLTFLGCKSARDQVIFGTFLVCSLKLLISDSFWYYPLFWAFLAIMVYWRLQGDCEEEPREGKGARRLPVFSELGPYRRLLRKGN